MFHKRNSFSINPISGLIAALFAPAMPLYAFDPNDPADKAALEEAVEKALAPIKAKRDELLSENRRLKQGAEIKPEDLQRVEQERDDLATKLADANKALKTANTQLEGANKALQGEQGYTHKLLVENGLRAALTEAGVSNPVNLKAAMAMIQTGAKVEVVADGENRVAKVGDKPLSEFVKEWSQGDEGKHFVAAQNNSGGGAPGSTQQQHKGAGNLGGTRDERTAAIAARFPNLPS